MHSSVAFTTSLPLLPQQRLPNSLTSVSPRRRPTMSTQINIGSVPEKLSTAVTKLAAETLTQRPTFNLAVSGGSLPKLLAAGLPPSHDLSSWRAYLADERMVPLDHADSNYREIKDRIPGLEVIPAATDKSPQECAEDYESKIGDLDVILLGLGPDGHTCSLFPDHPLLHESGRQVSWVVDSPKPPPKRITLTLPVLNAAKKVMFVCTGAGKSAVVKDILENPASKLPGALVKPDTVVEWFLDEAAASELSDATKS